jgi:lipopolysaccharide-induced tumor necrosis factor-alpha factor
MSNYQTNHHSDNIHFLSPYQAESMNDKSYSPPQQSTIYYVQPVQQMVSVSSSHHNTLDRFPTTVACQHCGNTIQTQVHHEAGTSTWLVCLLCCVIGCDAGCCLIPFCVDELKDTVHTCPSCHVVIGRKSMI